MKLGFKDCNRSRSATSVLLNALLEKFDSYSNKQIISELTEAIRSLRSQSVFLISYDFKNNNSKIKTTLLNESASSFRDSINEKKLPETTLVWVGAGKSTIQDALNNFKEKVKKTINSESLDTEFSRTIVVEAIEQVAAVEDKSK